MNELEIRRTLELIKQPNELIEVRIVLSDATHSGYFKSVDNIIDGLKDSKFRSGNVYFVLNKINEACYSREQHEKFIRKPKNTTSDNDIEKREWFIIDIDPVRPAAVSSNEEERQAAKDVVNKIFVFLRDLGFSAPFVCDSGNGFHLLYRIDLPNNEQSKQLISVCLQVLDMMFSSTKAEVDKTMFNASRITKLYGTVSRKGVNSEDRPQRLSHIIRQPEYIEKKTPMALLAKVAMMLPQPEKPSYQNEYGKKNFDLGDFIQKHGISVTSQQNVGVGTKYILEHCLFNDSHKGKDAAIFQLNNGALSYKCLHNSCSHYTWQDVRKMFDPDAYNNKNEFKRAIRKSEEIKPQETTPEKGSKFFRFSEIKIKDRTQIVSIPSGFEQMDRRIIGFNKGEITLWSGKNGSAKSTIINQISLNAIDNGFKGIIFSGELPAFKMKNWVHLQSAGRQFTKKSDLYENSYYVKKSDSQKIDSWLDDKLFVYNNEYGNNFVQLMSDIEELTISNGIDFIVLDNLMALDLLTLQGDKYEKQTQFINMLCAFVKKNNVHLHIVAHPRKQTGFLRKDDISGTADLTNAVDNVLICHRNNNDYRKAIEMFYPKEMLGMLTMHDNYIEVCKNRDMGVIDHMVGLYFEPESKRMLNEQYENKVYGWQDAQEQVEINLIYSNTNFYEPNVELETLPF